MDQFSLRYIYAALLAIFSIYLISTIYIIIFKVSHFQAGTFSQSCYRFNTYVAMAVALSAYGEEGAALLGILIAVAIPFINVLAVGTLIWYGKKESNWRRNILLTLRAIVSNPLILACTAGAFFSQLGFNFPVFINNTLHLVSMVALPLALLSIGGAMSFANLRNNLSLSLVSIGFKLILLPIIGYFFLLWFEVTALQFKIALLFFAMPTSTAIYVLSSQLNSDIRLAADAIVLSTFGSLFSLTTILILSEV
ncbi:MAG: AEC family transporter [Desulfobacteraceae bacterium]